MDVVAWLVWGFGATVVLTIVMAGAQGLGLTRMGVPYLLGTMLTADRDRARWLGVVVHVVNGWIFALIYVGAFHTAGLATWWFGALVGVVHAAFLLAVALPALPGLHPRMARTPTTTPMLEPPGFLATNYGWSTPATVLLAHVVYGAILGGFY